MKRNARFRAVAMLLALALLFPLGQGALAQDPRPGSDLEGVRPPGPATGAWEVSSTSDGYTVWRKEINSGCLFSDHNYTLDIPADPNEMSDIRYTMTNYDVDYQSTGCSGRPEVDHMFLNDHFLGILTGANNSWSLNSWPLQQSQVVSGTNTIYIDTDAPGTGCWCVGVGYIEVRARVGFEVTARTPQRDDRNRDFHADKLDLTVTFSREYGTSTLTNATFKLEYRNQAGSWQQVSGSFTQLAPDKFRFVPSGDLKDGIRYRATVKGGSSGVKGKGGGELDSDTVWYFWTVPNLDITDNFNYSVSACPPSAQPCPGLELAVFQVARNVNMVPNKPAVVRLYLRWKHHTDVHTNDQVREMQVDASVSVGGTTYSKRQTVKRPDRYSVAEKLAAGNTVNFYHTPASDSSYTAEVTPHPQTNATPVKYTSSRNLASTGRSPRMEFDYYFLKDGAWAAGVPAAAKTDGVNLMTAGAQFITDQFPVLGTSFNQKAEHSIGYTLTGSIITDTSCGPVNEVTCPGSGNKAELWCAYEKLQTMRGGHKFVAATVPNTLCPGATAFAIGDKVFMHQSGAGGNDGTIAHEVGHIYGISTANNPTRKHRNDSSGVEGFQVRTKINRSHVENPTKAVSLMHTTLKPTGTQWIDNTDYGTLLGSVPLAVLQAAALSASGPYLIVSGYVNTDTSSAELTSAFLQEVPNDPPSATGLCTIELLDESDAVLSSDRVTPGVEIHVDQVEAGCSRCQAEGSPTSELALAAGPQYFSVSLSWNDNAKKIRVSCDGTVLLTVERTSASPTVDFVGLANGDTLSGVETLTWTGSDADGPGLAYQSQFSNDAGASWTPLMPLGPGTSFDLDTTLLPSGSDVQLRIMATDGFNTSYVTRTVNIVNSLTVLGVLPADTAVDVSLNTPVQVLFASDVLTSTLAGTGFQVLENGVTSVDGTVSYDSVGRLAVFTPDGAFEADTSHTARLASTVQDVNGNSLGSTYEWSFTTISDTVPPLVVDTSPRHAQFEVPLNALVQAEFSEAMAPYTFGGFQLLDADNDPVAGTVVYNISSLRARITPSADLAPNTTYTAIIPTDATDAAGNPLESAYEWSFTTGVITTPNGLRIVGNYNDQANDTDGDGLYDNLTLYVDVEVLNSAYYNLNARLVDQHDELLEWQTTGNVYLNREVHTLQLVFDSVPIRSNGVDGPYTLDALNFYDTANTALSDLEYDAYQTFAYDVTGFYSVLTLGGLPDQLLEWNTTRDNAFNLLDYTTHATQPLNDVTYSIYVNTDPAVGVTIDDDSNIDINPPADTEAESDVTIQAQDSLGNRVLSAFHVSVQKPCASSFVVTAPSTMGLNESQQIDAEIHDQWDRLLTEPVTGDLPNDAGHGCTAHCHHDVGHGQHHLDIRKRRRHRLCHHSSWGRL